MEQKIDYQLIDGEQVIVPDPDETDLHQHSFVGTIVGRRNGYIQVADSDDNVFEIEPHRLISADL